LEEKTGSLAMDGTLQKLRKQKAKIRAKLSNPSINDDEKEDLVEEYKDVIEDAETEVAGVSTISDSFQTFDTEAEELISTVKGTPSRTMKDLISDIRARNSERELHARSVPEFEESKLAEYFKKAEASKNPKDKENATRLKSLVEKVQEEKGEDLTTLVREDRIDPELARHLLDHDHVKLSGSDVVDIEFAESDNSEMNKK
jgi:hypothetical protein